VQSVCPYCAVGCGQRVYVKDEKVVQIEGDPDSPIWRGRLCPKGAAGEQLVNSPGRQTHLLYRAPRATEWQRLDLDTALDMVADRFVESRRNGWQQFDEKGRLLRRTMGIASLGGATLLGGRRRVVAALSGLALMTASALTRFGVFDAGIHSAKDPRDTIEPQKHRLVARREAGVTDDSITTA
jgi:anaerobic selenocysteine-containing dehydrogenase